MDKKDQDSCSNDFYHIPGVGAGAADAGACRAQAPPNPEKVARLGVRAISGYPAAASTDRMNLLFLHAPGVNVCRRENTVVALRIDAAPAPMILVNPCWP